MERDLPLCVDLDGTLVRTDTLAEAFLSLFRSGWYWLVVPFWLLKGKAHLKRRMASVASLDVGLLPFNQELLAHLQLQRGRGRSVFLVTGADESMARRVADHVGCFEGVIASDGATNLTGQSKRAALETRFGRRGFDYAGNSVGDLPVLEHANRAFFVTPSCALLRKARRRGLTPAGVYGPLRRPVVRSLIRALRLHQWAKNALVLVAPLFAHHLVPHLRNELVAFLSFGAAASAIYVVNDLLDLQADRQHPSKRERPFAAGDLPIGAAIVIVPLLLAASGLLAVSLPPGFSLILGAYVLTTGLYSLWLKRILMVDVLVLAGLYTLRIMAGGAATDIRISPWTLAFSVFWFLSLAALKRVSELGRLLSGSPLGVPGRGYVQSDGLHMSILGGAAGYMSIVVLALYINSPDVQRLYSRSDLMWFALPFPLYWISRMWLLTGRGQMHDDPVIYAVKDPTTYAAGAAILAVALMSL